MQNNLHMASHRSFTRSWGLLALFFFASFTYAQEPDIEIGDQTLEQGLPIEPYYSYSYSQSIFLQEELDIPGKRITKIAYYYDGGRQWSDHINVYMAHTSQSSIVEFQVEGLIEVYAGNLGVMNEPGWVEIPLITPFEYNNEDNLLIAIKENTPGFRLNSQFYSSSAPGNMSILATKDASPPYDVTDPPLDGQILAYRPNIRLWFGEIPDGAAIAVVPSQLYFQYIREQEDKSLPVTIYNTGVDDLVIDGFEVEGLPYSSPFTGTIAPGQSASSHITFAPLAMGDYDAYFSFTGNMQDDPHQVYVTGVAMHELSIIETFQETTFPPDEWSVDENSWIRRGFGGYIGGGNATLQHPGQPGRLITPKINVQEGDQLIFYAAEFQDGELSVSYSPDQVSWTELASPELTRAYQPYVVDLDPAVGEHYIGFSGSPRVYLDYVITPPVAQEAPPQPAGQPLPPDGFEDAFLTQTLRWAASVFADGYRIYLGTDNPPGNVVDGQDLGTSRRFTTPALDYATTYYWQVVPYNSHGDAPDCPVWTFTTIGHEPVTVFPFLEGFEEEDGLVPPQGWINEDGHWDKTTNAHSGNYAARAPWNHPVDAILISPPILLPDNDVKDLVFYWINGDVFPTGTRVVGHDTLYVEISADRGQSWITGSILSAEESMSHYMPAKTYLHDFAGEEVHIRFRHSTDGNNQHAKSVAIDDIHIDTAVTEPVLWLSHSSWDAGSIPENTWLDSEHFTIRNLGGEILTISNAWFEGDYFTTTLDPAEVSLAFGEEYTFYFSFEPFEPGDFPNTFHLESNGGITAVSLDGNAQAVAPFVFEGFESGVFPPHGWMIHDEDGDEINWMIGYGHAIPPYNGQHSAISFSYVWGIGDLFPDNWLVTPKMEVGENQEFSFWVATEEVNYPHEHYSLYLSTTTNRLDQFTHHLHSETLQAKDTAWSERVFPLDEFAGQQVYMAFRHHDCSGQFLIKIDDVTIRDVFSVETPWADPEPGEVPAGTLVSLHTGTEGAGIFFTLDGGTPDNESTPYEDPIAIDNDTHIRAVAFKNDMYSQVADFHYTISTVHAGSAQSGHWRVYPNPVADLLHIEHRSEQPAEARLFGVQGEQVASISLQGDETQLPLKHLGPGVYVLEIQAGGERVHFRIIKK